MKFDKATVLRGSKIRDGLAVREQEMKLNELFETREQILESYSEDQPVIEERAREILRKAEQGELITRADLEKSFLREDTTERFRNNWLGLDKQSLDIVNRKIEAAEAQRQVMTASRLTRFLEMVEEEKVSDYAIRGAGFKVRLADLFMLGVEDEKQNGGSDAEEQSA